MNKGKKVYYMRQVHVINVWPIIFSPEDMAGTIMLFGQTGEAPESVSYAQIDLWGVNLVVTLCS